MLAPLIFFGSDRYSAVVLSSLLENRDTGILGNMLVVTDKQTDGSPVEKLAIAHNLKVAYYPSSLDKMNTFITNLESYFLNHNSDQPVVGLCASFDHLLPADLIANFGGHLYNLHPSLLPQYRNVSPVRYAIALGDKVTGITLFRIAPTIDDGEIIAQAEEEILPGDTTATLTPRLFAKGAELFLGFLLTPGVKVTSHSRSVIPVDVPLIFTHRLKRESGYIEWGVLHKLLQNDPVEIGESKNELLNLRLQKESGTHSHLTSSIYLLDLLRALTPWPTVWSTVPTKKGELRISLVFSDPRDILHSLFSVHISGKPAPISYADFTKYYLNV